MCIRDRFGIATGRVITRDVTRDVINVCAYMVVIVKISPSPNNIIVVVNEVYA